MIVDEVFLVSGYLETLSNGPTTNASDAGLGFTQNSTFLAPRGTECWC